jgi:hypothetical protein
MTVRRAIDSRHADGTGSSSSRIPCNGPWISTYEGFVSDRQTLEQHTSTQPRTQIAGTVYGGITYVTCWNRSFRAVVSTLA